MSRRIVAAALRLWTARGFEEGFETTTVEEIAEAAGASRATVYYYFPRKEDILRELAWTTADQIYELSLRLLMGGQPLAEIMDALMQRLGDMVARSPRAAVRRMLAIRDPGPDSLARDAAAGGMSRAFSVILVHAQQAGEIPRRVDAIEGAEMLTAIVMGAISRWSAVEDVDLAALLRRRAALLLAGVTSAASH